MRRKLDFSKLYWAAVAMLLTACFPIRSAAQQQGQKTFSSSQDAINALVAAAKSNDEQAMIAILGSDAGQIVSSGDSVQDAENRATFVQKYDQMHRVVKEPDGATTLYVGAENWPMPIPLMKKGAGWYFDTEAGKKEILFRRIGENEISTMRVCRELVAAEKEYYAMHHDEYAQKIFSDAGRHNGLYWKAANGEPKSPIGPLVASAVAEGYAASRNGSPTPYRGYYYHILTGQGKDAPGGAKSYVASGKMTQGFAFLAYPAEYRSSGVMTFIVSKDGIVYQKDLGKDTETLATDMKDYNPSATWQKGEDEQEETAADERSK